MTLWLRVNRLGICHAARGVRISATAVAESPRSRGRKNISHPLHPNVHLAGSSLQQRGAADLLQPRS